MAKRKMVPWLPSTSNIFEATKSTEKCTFVWKMKQRENFGNLSILVLGVCLCLAH